MVGPGLGDVGKNINKVGGRVGTRRGKMVSGRQVDKV